MNPSRSNKIDSVLSVVILLSFSAIIFGNVKAWNSSGAVAPRWIIDAGLLFGTLGAAGLSARVFWRHRIGLAAWMLMFAIQAVGMLLATQGFNAPEAVGVATAPSVERGVNALLLAAALTAALLVRGAELQATAAAMPGWMALRKDDRNATPRLWLFALYWISPIAWWAGIFYGRDIFIAQKAGAWTVAALTLSVLIAAVRLAVRLVLFEKNKYSNWRRSPQGWLKARAALNSLSFVLAAFVTFYACLFTATRVQDDALSARLEANAAERRAEIDAMLPLDIAPKDNAETIYKLASNALIRINWEWAEKNWSSAEARNEIARNLTALSFFKQASAVPGIRVEIDRRSSAFSIGASSLAELERMILLEARQAASSEKYLPALENFKASLNYLRHLSISLDVFDAERALRLESLSALTFAATILQPDSKPPDSVLVDLQKTIAEHLDLRGEFANRALYFDLLQENQDLYLYRGELFAWPGKADVLTMLLDGRYDWRQETELRALLATTKLAMNRRLDREASVELALRVRKTVVFYKPLVLPANLETLETLRLVQTAIGIKRYQRHFGAWPSSLNDCVPMFLAAIAPDPNKIGRVIQYESSPPRVFTIGSALSYAPEQHGFPDENYFNALSLKIKECENGNRVLFLAN